MSRSVYVWGLKMYGAGGYVQWGGYVQPGGYVQGVGTHPSP